MSAEEAWDAMAAAAHWAAYDGFSVNGMTKPARLINELLGAVFPFIPARIQPTPEPSEGE